MTQQPGRLRRIDATGIPLLLARLGVGGMFTYLAIIKLLNPIHFLKALRTYGIMELVPYWGCNLIAIVLPTLELTCAIALLLGIGIRGAALLINGMLAFFTPLLVVHALELLHAGKFAAFCAVKFDCGCGTGEVFICPKLAENIALQVGALIALFSASRRFCLAALCACCQGRCGTSAAPAGMKSAAKSSD